MHGQLLAVVKMDEAVWCIGTMRRTDRDIGKVYSKRFEEECYVDIW